MVNSDLPITGVALLIVVVAAVIHAEVQAGDISPAQAMVRLNISSRRTGDLGKSGGKQRDLGEPCVCLLVLALTRW